MDETQASLNETPRGPVAHTTRCSTCGGPVDPLRAARVRILRERFRYFCSSECSERFDGARLSPLPQKRRPRPQDDGALVQHSSIENEELAARKREATELGSIASDKIEYENPLAEPLDPNEADLGEDANTADVSGDDRRTEVIAEADVGALLLAIAILGGVLSIALILAGSSGALLSARVVVVAVACAALVAESALGSRDPMQPHPLAILAAPTAGSVTAVLARLFDHAGAGSAATLAGAVVALTAAGQTLVQRARRPVEAEREQIRVTLASQGHRVVGEDVAAARADDLRPGEEIVVEAGETVPVDATISAGTATVRPWLRAKHTERRSEGNAVVAGAEVTEGRIRAVVGWAGFDRAWARLVLDPRRRADLLAPLASGGRLLAERAAPLAAGLSALAAFAANHGVLDIALFAIAAQAAIATPTVAHMSALCIARGVLEGLRRGVAFRTAEAFDTAGRVTVAAFCARGTLLLGEPEVANVEAIGGAEPGQVLALAAGAESGASHPAAAAVLRAARARGVRPDGARSHNFKAGLGITAVASSGQRLVVGSRALMLQERISVAAAESMITDFEAMGRSVLLVALGGRLVGALGLQDGLRPGARAAVQHLLDVNVEPVLLSGDARETCEAIGRALDIEHIRPEVLPTERGEEIRRLADGGATVAVIGKSPADDSALSSAEVSVALGSAGSTLAEWGVQLASDDVRDAAYAIRLAHQARSQARLGLIVSLAPGLLTSLGVAVALVPPLLAPVAAAAGGLFAILWLRAPTD